MWREISCAAVRSVQILCVQSRATRTRIKTKFFLAGQTLGLTRSLTQATWSMSKIMQDHAVRLRFLVLSPWLEDITAIH